jgi:hypothetical protein
MAIMSEVLSAIDAARGAIELNRSYEVATISLAMSPWDCHATATAAPTPTQNVIRRPKISMAFVPVPRARQRYLLLDESGCDDG